MRRNISLLLLLYMHMAAAYGGDVTIIDATHYSKVLGEVRNFRIFLPPDYFENTSRRYPVIYFYHGWSQRYFGSSDHYADFDNGDENQGDNISNFVSSHDVIVVKADGYNRSPGEKYYVRPYNVSPVETYRQFPEYFPELVEHIDANYKTIADREHRGISGLSMGGFMTFWIGGKYPHLLSAAGNFCGSPEFEVGPKDLPVEYRHIDMFRNYEGMNVRLHYGDKDFIRGYHDDLNRVWPQVMDNYSSKMYEAAHSTCGMADMFNFMLNTFENPPPRPSQWNHIDVYPKFSVWDYTISSDRRLSGFTILENVDQRGFKCTVREFLPDGEVLPFVNLTVTTPPLYEKNQRYTIHDFNTRTGTASVKTILSNPNGTLQISLTGGGHEVGINKNVDKPNVTVARVHVANMAWATHNKDIILNIQLFNKGASLAKNVKGKLSGTRNTAHITQGDFTFGDIPLNRTADGKAAFKLRVSADSIEVERFQLTLQDADNNVWTTYFEVPFKKDVPEIKSFQVADGRVLTVVNGAKDSVTLRLGRGNGDGIPNPGESIVIVVRDQNKLWRTDLTFSDPYLNPFGVNVRRSDNWTPFDHVGGSAKYDIPLISSDCPDNHPMTFFVEYWQPEYPYHIIRQGRVKIVVKGTDKTPPQVEWVKNRGDNAIQVKAHDGSRIQSVKLKLTSKSDSTKSLDVDLNDDGIAGDITANDRVFTRKVEQQKFGMYKVSVEAVDSFGNKSIEDAGDDFILH
jgi:poly(3-hydroxybutyrate) depolymerase